MNENEGFLAKYESMGEDEVRSQLAQGIITGRGIVPAEEYLRRLDVRREAQDRTASEAAQQEQTRLAREAASSAAAAATAAREQAAAAREANEVAQRANIIATLALIAAVIAIAVSIVGTFIL